MATPKKGAVEVGSTVVVEDHPLQARVLRIEGNMCKIQFVDDSVAVVHLSSVTKSVSSLTTSSSNRTVSHSSSNSRTVSDNSDSSSTDSTRTTYTTESTVTYTTRSTRTTTTSPRVRSKTPTKRVMGRSQSRSAGRSGTITTSSSSRTSRSPGRKAVSPTTPSPTKNTPGKSPTKRSLAARSPGRTCARSPSRTSTSRSPGRPAAKTTHPKSPTGRPPAAKSPRRPRSPAAKSPRRPRSPAAKSPGRPRSPAAKSPRRPKSPAAKSPARRTPAAAKTTRATSKSPARTPTQRKKSVSPTKTSSQKAGPPRMPTSSTSSTTTSTERSPARDRSSASMPHSFTVSQPVVNLGSKSSITRRVVSTGTSTEESPQIYNAQAQRSSARIAAMRSAPDSNSSFQKLNSSCDIKDAFTSLELEDEGEGPSRMGRTSAVAVRGRWHFLFHLPLVTLRFGLGTTLGALGWFFLVPSLTVVLYLVCQKESCTVLKVPPLPRNVNSYFHWKLYAFYAAFLALQAVLQALPLGRRVQGFTSKAFKQRVAYDYRLNGWVNLLGTVALFGALTYYRFPMVIPYRYILPLLVTTVVFAPVLSLLLYIKGRFAPWHHRFPPGNTGNVLNDYIKGRELSPRIGQTFDLAALCFRCGLLTWVVLLGSMAFQEYTTWGRFDYGFATSAVCQFLYICMVFFDEEYFLSSAFVTDDGLGYVAVAGNLVLMPFVSALPAKFLLEQRPRTLPWYCLAGIGLLFLIGQGAMHFAHKRKYQLRRNWPDPNSRGPGLDYLMDNHGNRLLVSGLWGMVRHPNYLGDLLCHLAFALPCGHRHLLPFYSVLLSTLFLVARTVSVESKCRKRYGDLWTRYTQRVKHRLVPYIF